MTSPQSESGLSLLARVETRLDVSQLDSHLFPNGIKVPQIVEVFGGPGCGKSLLCLHLVTSALLPSSWKGVNVGGAGCGVIYFDTNKKFSILQLQNMMEIQIRKKIRIAKDLCKSDDKSCIDKSILNNKKEFESFNKLDKIERKKEIVLLVKSRLKDLLYLKCDDSVQFAVTLLSLDNLVLNTPNVSVLFVDSISAYYWYNRAYRVENWYKMEQYYNKLLKVFLNNIKRHKLLLVCTKQDLFNKKTAKDSDKRGISLVERDDVKEELYSTYEYLGKEWSKNVTTKIHFLLSDIINKVDSGDVQSNLVPTENKQQYIYSAEITTEENRRKLFCTFHGDGIHWIPP